MTKQHDLEQELREWMQDVPPVHPSLGVMIVETTRQMPQQRRRLWPWAAGRTWRASIGRATRYAVAAMVVAIFGGFLLLGILISPPAGPVAPGASATASPSPSPVVEPWPQAESTPVAEPTSAPEPSLSARPSIPPTSAVRAFEETMADASTVELQPGVERIAADGMGNEFITWREPFAQAGAEAFRPVVGPEVAEDGSVWLAGYHPTGAVRLGRLGEATVAALDTAISENDEGLWLRSAPDGSIWVGGADGINHFDGRTWYWLDTEYVRDVHAVEVAPDSAAWVVWSRDGGPDANRLARVDREGWIDHEADVSSAMDVKPDSLLFRDVVVSVKGRPSVVVDVVNGAERLRVDTAVLQQVEGTWKVVEPPAGLADARPLELTSAADGSLWGYYLRDSADDEPPRPLLAHEIDGSMTVVSDVDAGMPAMRERRAHDPPRDGLKVGADGTVWLEMSSGQLASFDGTAWATRGVAGIDAFDLAPDGTAIVLDAEGMLSQVRAGGDVVTLGSGSTGPTVRPETEGGEPLAALVTERLAPGVRRIISDGIRELTYPASSQDRRILESNTIVAGRDGSVWAFGPEEYYRLGAERTYRWDQTSPSYGEPPAVGERPIRAAGQIVEPSAWDDIEVAADGTVWYALGRPGPWTFDGDVIHALWTFDGEAWTPQGPVGAVAAVELPGDGSAWASWRSGARPEPTTPEQSPEPAAVQVRRLVGGEWQAVGEPVNPSDPEDAAVRDGLHVSDGGDAWLVAGAPLRWQDGRWRAAPLPPEVREFGDLDLGEDGTPWVAYQAQYGNPDSDMLARFEAGSWTAYQGDGMPGTGNARWPIPHQVGPDGSVWMGLNGHLECGGIGRFDGESWQTYLPGTCIYAFDIAPDGRVWLHGGAVRWNALGDDLLGVRPIETYLIDPGVEQGGSQ